jgi:glycosyltransferase involved in cell wall biosynthesis
VIASPHKGFSESHLSCLWFCVGSQRRVAVLYHYFYPDDVVSARHFEEFCVGLAERGWEVEVLPSNRSCRDESQAYRLREEWQGIAIRRIWRPPFRQASGLGRILNAAWMLAAWCGIGLRQRERVPDVLVLGTDPIFSVLVALVVRILRPSVRIAHWCFDLYPESAVVEGLFPARGILAGTLHYLLQRAYAACDLIADLGGCMRQRLKEYDSPARHTTLIPWALAEPDEVSRPDPETRRQLFGTEPLGLLYSGNFGRAHSYREFLELARLLRGDGVHVCFGVRGNRANELRAAIGPNDSNVSLAGFAPETELVKRLAAADIHLVSLRPEWTGLVVPSKFFGSLAAGRPVIFAGSREAAIARWIEEHQVGWVLDAQSRDAVAAELRSLAGCPERLHERQRHCQQVYQQHFSRRRIMDQWDQELQALLVSRHKRQRPRT